MSGAEKGTGRPGRAYVHAMTAPDPMAAAAHIRIFGDPTLRTVCQPVTRFDAHTHGLAVTLRELLIAAGGVGLAAPQIGTASRLLVYRLNDHPDADVGALVNPAYTDLGEGHDVAVEGCLSLPGLPLPVRRHQAIRVTGQGLAGEPLQFDTDGFEARVLQHEIDHLNGVLILDRVAPRLRYEALMNFKAPAGMAQPSAPSQIQTHRPAVSAEQMALLQDAAAAVARGDL